MTCLVLDPVSPNAGVSGLFLRLSGPEPACSTGQFDKMKSPFEWDIVTRGLVAMTVEGFVGFFLTIMCQYNFLRQPQ